MSKTLSHLVELNRSQILRYGTRKLPHDQATAVLADTLAEHPDVEPSVFIELYGYAVAKRAEELSDVPTLHAVIDQMRERGFADGDVIRSFTNAISNCHPALRESIVRRLENAATDGHQGRLAS